MPTSLPLARTQPLWIISTKHAAASLYRAAGRAMTFLVGIFAVVAASAQERTAGDVFKDCDECPEMIVIQAGSFDMGLPPPGKQGPENADPVRKVTIRKAFAISRTEVTQKQWRAVMGTYPVAGAVCDDCPAEFLSWNAAMDFVRRMRALTGKDYRLPSEAEWEYACRAGGRHEYCGSDAADVVAWHEGNSSGGAHRVAGKQANAFGLYDMSGNVWEWTADCWNNGYIGAPADGNAWLDGNCASRVLRGGSWQYRADYSSAIVRAAAASDVAGRSDGVRVVRSLP